jgi:hypothetical protein
MQRDLDAMTLQLAALQKEHLRATAALPSTAQPAQHS